MKAWLEETTFNIDDSKAIVSRIGFGWGAKRKTFWVFLKEESKKLCFSTKDLIGGQTCFPIHQSWQSKGATVDPLAS